MRARSTSISFDEPLPGRPVLAADPRRDAAVQKRPDRPPPAFHDMVSRVSTIERAPIFFSVHDTTIRALARRTRRLKFNAGDMILFQGEQGDSIFFVERGRCRVVVEKSSGVVTVALLAEGEIFGEGACLLNRPQQASVYAQTECYLLAIDRQSLHLVMASREHEALDQLRSLADQRFTEYADASVQATWSLLLHEATVAAVYSPKGGSGGTAISLNLVGALARKYPGEVLLLDLDFPYSHSALLAGLIPTSCLARMSSIPQESFEEVLLSAVLYHAGGPMILPGALRPEEADDVTPELITRAISVLRKSFRYVIVDLGVTITDATLALLDLTQHMIVVTVPELSAVKSAADAIDILRQLGTPHDRVTVVLNNRTEKGAITRSAVERSLKRTIDLEVGFDAGRPEQAAVDAQILSLTNSRSELTKGAEALAALLEARHAHPSPRGAVQSPVPAGVGEES